MAQGSTQLKVTLVGGHAFLADAPAGSDPSFKARYILTYGASEEHEDGSCTVHPLSRISAVSVQAPAGTH